jgi:hypothetical protein
MILQNLVNGTELWDRKNLATMDRVYPRFKVLKSPLCGPLQTVDPKQLKFSVLRFRNQMILPQWSVLENTSRRRTHEDGCQWNALIELEILEAVSAWQRESARHGSTN